MDLFINDETQGMPDENYMNHTAWYTSSSHNASHRLNAAMVQMKNKCGWGGSVASGDCKQWNFILRCLRLEREKAQEMPVSSRGRRRVRDRMIKAAKQLISKCVRTMKSNGCPIFSGVITVPPITSVNPITLSQVNSFIDKAGCKALNGLRHRVRTNRIRKRCASGFIGGGFIRP